MARTRLYLIRHGEQGPSGLSDLGREQAGRLGERLHAVPFAAIHHSPLPRAAETAEIIGARLTGVPAHPCDFVADRTPYPTGKQRDHYPQRWHWSASTTPGTCLNDGLDRDRCCQTHDVDDLDPGLPPPLHEAAKLGLPLPVVERRLQEAGGADAVWCGRTPLWEAVMYRHYEVARFLADAGADPWRPLIGGWSPGRLALAGPVPTLFGAPDSHLTAAEFAAITRARRLIGAVGDPEADGMSIAFLTHLDSAEAAGRLRARPIEVTDFAEWALDPWSQGMTDHEVAHTAGVSDVPGGCVLTQWAGFTAATPAVLTLLTPGISAYAMSTDPKNGTQGITFHHGHPTGFDLRPGSGWCDPEDTGPEVLRAYLYRDHPVAYCCDAAGLTPESPQPFTGPPAKLLRLPPIDLRDQRPGWPGRS